MKVEIEGKALANGVWWGVNIAFGVSDDKSAVEKIAFITKTIEAICQSGHIVSRIEENKTTSPIAGQQIDTAPGVGNNGGAAYTWPPPTCSVHRENLAVSKNQNKPGKVVYYCPKRLGDAYCNKRCTVDERTGKPSFWEVTT